MKILLFLAALLLAGCGHIPPGGATSVHVKFGVPAVFSVTQDLSNLKSTAKTVTVGDTSTEVQILLFVWESNAKGVKVANPAPEKEDDK